MYQIQRVKEEKKLPNQNVLVYRKRNWESLLGINLDIGSWIVQAQKSTLSVGYFLIVLTNNNTIALYALSTLFTLQLWNVDIHFVYHVLKISIKLTRTINVLYAEWIIR